MQTDKDKKGKDLHLLLLPCGHFFYRIFSHTLKFQAAVEAQTGKLWKHYGQNTLCLICGVCECGK